MQHSNIASPRLIASPFGTAHKAMHSKRMLCGLPTNLGGLRSHEIVNAF
jgi:hypothetical protein